MFFFFRKGPPEIVGFIRGVLVNTVLSEHLQRLLSLCFSALIHVVIFLLFICCHVRISSNGGKL